MTNELFEKYLKGACTPEEKKSVMAWLQQQDRSALDEVLQQRWQQSGEQMPAAETRLLWQSLARQLPVAEPLPAGGRLIKTWFRRLSVAAAILLLAASVVVWYQHQQHTAAATAVLPLKKDTLTTPAMHWVTVRNDAPMRKTVTLEDGSVAILNRHAAIQYQRGFEPHQRKIMLSGTAFFTVAKDKQRPFSVHSGDIVTTAIGTAFSVTWRDAGSPVLVQLYEGKVRVQQTPAAASGNPVAAVYLLPGEQCSYQRTDRRMAVTRFSRLKEAQEATVAGAPEDALKDTLLFNNKPLAAVLQQLQQRYNTTIQYKDKEIADIYFSGKVVKTDSLQMVLRIIAQMNALQLNQQNGQFQLSKQP